MSTSTKKPQFESVNTAYNTVFRPNKMSIGLVVPIENYAHSPVPTMRQQTEKIQLVEQLGFSAVWLRDVPFNVPSFGDTGQIYDPFVYLGILAAQTSRIALGVASIILPLRHPAHIAKAAASVDVLSDGRLILGVASGDRPDEYPALNIPFPDRGERFRESFEYIKRMWESTPEFNNHYGHLAGHIDMLPKPASGRFPMLITGGSQQTLDCNAHNGDGWMLYPRDIAAQARIINDWNNKVNVAGRPPQPVMQPLYLDLLKNDDAPLQPIHLGFRTGLNQLKNYLKSLEGVGINHVALNLRFNQMDINTTLNCLADKILPDFSTREENE